MVNPENKQLYRCQSGILKYLIYELTILVNVNEVTWSSGHEFQDLGVVWLTSKYMQEAVVRRCSVKKVFLKTSQISFWILWSF